MSTRGIILLTALLLVLAPAFFPPPEGISGSAWKASGLALGIVLLWLTEALPLATTALLPLAVAPLLGLEDFDEVARSYSHPLVVLFLGGFLLAKAIERCGLHKRIAYGLLRNAGQDPGRILGAIMVTTAFLSLWISNTASAMVMAPVAAAIAGTQVQRPGFGVALMLGVAYAATVGGMGSLIGTPPNALFAAYVGETYGIDVGFAEWAAVALPVATVLLFVAWWMLARLYPGVEGETLSMSFGQDKPPMGRAERRVAVIAGLTALAWISRPLLTWMFPGLAVTDAGIAMIAVLLLFSATDGQGGRLLDWESAAMLRWDVLILFGGGLALAGLLETSGLAGWIGSRVEMLDNLPELLLLLLIAGLIVYVGELASNTAMAAIFLPIAGAAAVSMNFDPVLFMLPVALAASIGFMLPVATPPNAIVFSDPAVNRGNMMRAGAPLDLIGIILTVGLTFMVGPVVFG